MTLRSRVKKVLVGIDKLSPRPLGYSFLMTVGEKKLFDKHINDSRNYLEFGMGGSTFHVLLHSKATIYSVDSSSDWINAMREYSLVRNMEKKRLSLFYVDTGPSVRGWGYPDAGNAKELFPKYSAGIFSQIDKKVIDTVLVDGRFRVACTLQTILNCNGNERLKIMIHDFWDRKEYHIVLKYLDEIGRADRLGVFTIKKQIDLNAIEADYEQYKYNSR
jgi:hypothetical protein